MYSGVSCTVCAPVYNNITYETVFEYARENMSIIVVTKIYCKPIFFLVILENTV